MTTRETIKALCICGTLSNIFSSLVLLHYECSIIWCYHYCSAYCLVWKEIKERDEDYKMPQIFISITNPLNLWYVSVTELKGYIPTIIGITCCVWKELVFGLGKWMWNVLCKENYKMKSSWHNKTPYP